LSELNKELPKFCPEILKEFIDKNAAYDVKKRPSMVKHVEP